MLFKILIFGFSALFFGQANAFLNNQVAVTTDSRIRTITYSQHNVVPLNLTMNFQTVIEFAENEEIEILSVGDPFPWELNPIGHKLFIKPNQPGATTNLFIWTNKRFYSFELSSVANGAVKRSDMVYIMRFIYPDLDINNQSEFDKFKEALEFRSKTKQNGPKNNVLKNFNYSVLTNKGPLVPIEIYDDGKKTFVRFENDINPQFFMLDAKGLAQKIDTKFEHSYFIIDKIYPKLLIRFGSQTNTIFNETLFQK
jgi:type IV secretion system protein VirB9